MTGAAGIRAALHARIDDSAPLGSVVIDEYAMSSCIADVAVFTPTALDVYEIKSDADSHRRLAGQVSAYQHAASTCTLVCGPRLFAKCAAIVPEWWGLWSAVPDGVGVTLAEQRAPQANPNTIPLWVVHLLWSTEIWQELRARGLSRGISKHREAWAPALLKAVGGVQGMRAIVFEHIGKRQWWQRRERSVRRVARAA